MYDVMCADPNVGCVCACEHRFLGNQGMKITIAPSFASIYYDRTVCGVVTQTAIPAISFWAPCPISMFVPTAGLRYIQN